MVKIKILCKFQAELLQFEILQLQCCKISFFSQCNILLKLSIELDVPQKLSEVCITSLLWLSADIHWHLHHLYDAKECHDLWEASVSFPDTQGFFSRSGSHGFFLIWFKSLSTEQWVVPRYLERSVSGCYHIKRQVTGRNSRCECTVRGRVPKPLQIQSKGQIFQDSTFAYHKLF